MLLKIALHTADVGNPSKPFEIMKAWTDRVMTEFFAQGDREASLKLPVSQNMDSSDKIAKQRCQVAFITYIVRPTYEAWGKLVVKLLPIFNQNLDRSLTYWKNEMKTPETTAPVPPTPAAQTPETEVPKTSMKKMKLEVQVE